MVIHNGIGKRQEAGGKRKKAAREVHFGIFAFEGAGETNTAGGLLAIIITLLTTFLPFCIIGLFILVEVAFVVYGLYGAARALQGYDFRYALIGRRLEEYLNQERTAT